jgi:hypothetical protein
LLKGWLINHFIKSQSMKNINFFRGRVFAVAMIAFASVVILSSCSKDNDPPETNTTYSISGNASGSQMVPAVQGNGTATISGTYNAGTRTLVYTTNWNNLSGGPTMGSFYTGALGQGGTAVGTAWTLGTNPGVTGTASGTMILTEAQQASLLNGNWYYSLGTPTNANGEVRGQITASPL